MESDILNLQTQVRLVKQDVNNKGFWQDFGDENWKRCSFIKNSKDMSFYISVYDLVKNNEVFQCEINFEIEYKMLRPIVYTMKTEDGYIGVWFKIHEDATTFDNAIQWILLKYQGNRIRSTEMEPPNETLSPFTNRNDSDSPLPSPSPPPPSNGLDGVFRKWIEEHRPTFEYSSESDDDNTSKKNGRHENRESHTDEYWNDY